MKKILLAGIIISIIFISNVYAAAITSTPIELESEDNLWKIEDITSNDTLIGEKGIITTKGNTTTITYSGRSFRLLKGTGECSDPSSVSDPKCKGETKDRPYGYSWIGFKITPLNEDGSEKNEGILNVKLPNSSEINTATKDEKKKPTFYDYIGINTDKLKAALTDNKILTYTYNVMYSPYASDTENNIKPHIVNIEIDPATIILYKVNSSGTDPKDIEYNGPDENKSLRTQKIDETPKVKAEANSKISINSIVIIVLLIVSVAIMLYIIKKSNKSI